MGLLIALRSSGYEAASASSFWNSVFGTSCAAGAQDNTSTSPAAHHISRLGRMRRSIAATAASGEVTFWVVWEARRGRAKVELANRSRERSERLAKVEPASRSRERSERLAKVGGPDRDRTGDLLNAIQARSQLRHRPTLEFSIIGGTDTMRQLANAAMSQNCAHFVARRGSQRRDPRRP